MSSEPSKIDVAQLVIRRKADGDQFLLARRAEDGYWEFIGGKREESESIEDAALRELDEELHSVDPKDATIIDVAESYPSSFGSEYTLIPVLIELPEAVSRSLDSDDLSNEHSALNWVDIGSFAQFESLGQFTALVRLGLANED